MTTLTSRVLLVLLTCLGVAGAARADIQIPETPAQQVQKPTADHPAPGPSLPVAVTVQPTEGGDETQPETPADLGAFIKTVLDQAVAGNTATVMVEPSPGPPAEPPPGAAKNFAAEPPKPQATITATIAKRLVSPTLGDAYAPVELTIARNGKTVASEKFQVVPASRDKARAAITHFVVSHLPPAGSTPQPTAAGPQIRLWMESTDGEGVKIGSQVAVYWQPTKDGYISLYHFGASGAVERVFPTTQQPENFVQAGRTYRFPTAGFLTFKGPAGQETFRAVITSYPSNTLRAQPGGAQFKGEPLRIIPTHYPMLFANEDLSRVFALPATAFGETHLTYTLLAK